MSSTEEKTTLELEQINLNQNRLNNEQGLNNAVQPLLTDLYQLSMAYAYWKNKKRQVCASWCSLP